MSAGIEFVFTGRSSSPFWTCPETADWTASGYSVTCKKVPKCGTKFETTDGFCVQTCQLHPTRTGLHHHAAHGRAQSPHDKAWKHNAAAATHNHINAKGCEDGSKDTNGAKLCGCTREEILVPLPPPCCNKVYAQTFMGADNADGPAVMFQNNIDPINGRRAYTQVGTTPSNRGWDNEHKAQAADHNHAMYTTSQRRARLHVARFDKYLGYPGALGDNIKGTLYVDDNADGSLTVTFDLQLNEVSKPGQIHITADTHCNNNAANTGSHWHTGSADPWTKVASSYYTEPNKKAKESFTLTSGYTYADNIGHAVVIHDSKGDRIACGVLAATVDTKQHWHLARVHKPVKNPTSLCPANVPYCRDRDRRYSFDIAKPEVEYASGPSDDDSTCPEHANWGETLSVTCADPSISDVQVSWTPLAAPESWDQLCLGPNSQLPTATELCPQQMSLVNPQTLAHWLHAQAVVNRGWQTKPGVARFIEVAVAQEPHARQHVMPATPRLQSQGKLNTVTNNRIGWLHLWRDAVFGSRTACVQSQIT